MRCERCGQPGRPYDFVIRGEVLLRGVSCAPCIAEAEAEIAAYRAEFQALLEAGVSRTEANEIIINRMEQGRQEPS